MKNPSKFLLSVSFISISALALQSCTDGSGATNKIPAGSEPIPVKIIQLQKSGSTAIITASGQLTTEDETSPGI